MVRASVDPTRAGEGGGEPGAALTSLPTADCVLPTIEPPLPTADCVLPTTEPLLPTADCVLPTTAHCLLPHCLLRAL